MAEAALLFARAAAAALDDASALFITGTRRHAGPRSLAYLERSLTQNPIESSVERICTQIYPFFWTCR